MSGQFIPFFVADRQASLRILSGLQTPPGKSFGIMSHANTFAPFKKDLANWPCFDKNNCGVIDGPCPHAGRIENCRRGLSLQSNVVKVADSGVFQKGGCVMPTYERLYDEYSKMGVQYGVIIDVIKDKQKTLDSASRAIRVYEKKPRSFKLIGVAQGNTVADYVGCYQELKKMGYVHIAVGGMLTRRENSARYVTVRDERLLRDVLSAIREKDKDGWIFALGCYSPSRHSVFLENAIYGADYKGWIFQYDNVSKKRGAVGAQRTRFKSVRGFIEDQILARAQQHRKGPRLLVVSCAKKKRGNFRRMQAIERYDGPRFNLLRKYIWDFSNNDGLDIAILSAKYGLIQPKKEIEIYDLRMTSEIARMMKPRCEERLMEMIAERGYSEVMVDLGAEYFQAIEGAINSLPSNRVTILKGRNGQRLRELRQFILS